MTVMQVLGCGVEKGTREYEVDELEEMELLPKQQINIVVEIQFLTNSWSFLLGIMLFTIPVPESLFL